MPIMPLESCKKGYKDGNEDALITGDTFCGGLLNKDSCKVSTILLMIYPLDLLKPNT